jgi:hypothetical protein
MDGKNDRGTVKRSKIMLEYTTLIIIYEILGYIFIIFPIFFFLSFASLASFLESLARDFIFLTFLTLYLLLADIFLAFVVFTPKKELEKKIIITIGFFFGSLGVYL